MATRLENLQAAQENIAQLIRDLTDNPKPTYSVGGKSVSWESYLAMLIKEQESLDASVARASSPYQVNSRGRA